MDERILAELSAADKLGIQMNRQNSDLDRLKKQQASLRSQNFKNNAKWASEARKEENLRKTEDLRRQLAAAAEERKRIMEDAKRRPQRVYGRSHPPLRAHDYAPPPSKPDVARIAGTEPTVPQATNGPSAYDGDITLDATQLTQFVGHAPEGETFGRFVPPADYQSGPLSQFEGSQSLEPFNFGSLYPLW
jgi:hypothetical protein